MAEPLRELFASRQRFWVESTPDAEAPPNIVATQLKILIPVGTAIIIVALVK